MDANASTPIRWDRLCKNISNNNVIPVIGNEMYQFGLNGVQAGSETHFSAQLLQKNGIENSSLHTIAASVDFLLNENRANIRDIIEDLQSIVASKADYPVLHDFLALDQMFFYVNTTVYGNILKNIIDKTRDVKAQEANFSINETFADYGNINTLKTPFVFNIFGSLSSNVSPALKEEEMLEFTTSLIGKMGDSRFGSILDALKNKTLLFLGCSQPSWLIRFLFRLLSNDRIDNWQKRSNDIIIVNNKSDERELQFRFLKNYKAITYAGETKDFVTELSSQWAHWIKDNPPAPKNVFLSYSHADKEAADKMFAKLSAIPNVQCWYDNSDLQSGDNFPVEIIVNIDNADLFIPLISNNSIAGDNTYVKREWVTAFNTNVNRKIKTPDRKNKYLLPVAIDNANLGSSVINEYFPALTIATIPGGNADDGFIDLVKKELEIN